MNWKLKLEHLKALRGERTELTLYFECAEPAPKEFSRRLLLNYPFLPSSYLEFLDFSDGIQLHWFVLFGSGLSSFQSLENQIPTWNLEGIDLNYELPIGKDSSGDALILGEGSVGLLLTDGPPKMDAVTDTFDKFIGDYVLGANYPDLFGGDVGDDDWYKMLVDLNWA